MIDFQALGIAALMTVGSAVAFAFLSVTLGPAFCWLIYHVVRVGEKCSGR